MADCPVIPGGGFKPRGFPILLSGNVKEKPTGPAGDCTAPGIDNACGWKETWPIGEGAAAAGSGSSNRLNAPMPACCAGLGTADGDGSPLNFGHDISRLGFADRLSPGVTLNERPRIGDRRLFKPPTIGLNEEVFVRWPLSSEKFPKEAGLPEK